MACPRKKTRSTKRVSRRAPTETEHPPLRDPQKRPKERQRASNPKPPTSLSTPPPQPANSPRTFTLNLAQRTDAHPRPPNTNSSTSASNVDGGASASGGAPAAAAVAQPEVYDRPFNARDPHGANPWDTTRDLPLIWSTPGRAGSGFGPRNTVMVDDTPRKMRFMDAGLVVVPEFTAASVVEALGGHRGGRGAGTGAEGVAAAAEAGWGGEREEAREQAAQRQRDVLPRLLEYLR